MAAGDVNAAAGPGGATRGAGLPAGPGHHRPAVVRAAGRPGRDGGHPMAAVLASLPAALTARPVDAERWADAVDRWQYGDPRRAEDPSTEAWAALVRAILCRHGLERMREDADEAVRRFGTESFATSAPALMQGIARVLSGDLDGGAAALEDAASIAEKIGVHEDLMLTLSERALAAFERSEWDQAQILADEAHAALRRPRREESCVAPPRSPRRKPAALHRGDLVAVRQHLVAGQRLRPLLTYARPVRRPRHAGLGGCPDAHSMIDCGHGRHETRIIQVLPAPAGIFPHAAQAVLIERIVRDPYNGRLRSAVAAFGVTSRPAGGAAPPGGPGHRDPAPLGRGGPAPRRRRHDEEDASRLRSGTSAQVTGAIRNIVIASLRLVGFTNTAAGRR